MQYMQGMAHAEFPDYVSDAARNLILRLCRWKMLIFSYLFPGQLWAPSSGLEHILWMMWVIKILISTHLYRTIVLPYGIGDSQRYH